MGGKIEINLGVRPVTRCGGNLTIIIPKRLAEHYGIKHGDIIEIIIRKTDDSVG